MYKVLVVDDDRFNLVVMSKILENQYEVVTFRSGKQIIAYLQENTADLILMDYLMPEMDGLELLTKLRKEGIAVSIPVVVLTASRNTELEIAFFKAGAEDFITKPFSPEVVCSRISRILELNALRDNLQNKLDEKTKQMENVILQAFTTVANIVDAKDDFAEEHSIKVAKYAARIAKELDWSDQDIHNIYYAGLLHDIGKISVPDKIIRKIGSLNEREWKVMQGHTSVGAEILKDVQMVKGADTVALYHHEWFDGTGYPMGLKGDAIPLEARIVNLANAYDTMVSHRIYKNKLSNKQIIQELEEGKGTQFDPALVEILVKLIKEKAFDDKEDALPSSLQEIFAKEDSSQLLLRVLEANTNTVKREAMKDSLTGLFNREFAEKNVERYLKEKQKCSFLMIDLDNFKLVNDRYGHIAGDYALRIVANMLVEYTKEVGIVCRMGGDEFSIFITKDMNAKELRNFAASMLEEYNRVKMENDSMAETSLSLGVAVAPEDGTHYQDLYDSADKALYLSKRAGKNRYCFFNEGVAEPSEKKESVVDLHQLKELMQMGNSKRNSYKVPYKDFQRIYNFILRCMERNNQSAQLVLFTLQTSKGMKEAPDVLEEEIRKLEMVIVNSLRRNDVSTRYSSSQILVVLVDSKREFVDEVIERIEEHYETIQHPACYEIMTERISLIEEKKN